MAAESQTENFQEEVKEIGKDIEECWSLILNKEVKKEIKLEAKAHILSSYEKIIPMVAGKDLDYFTNEFNTDKIVLETVN